MWRVQPGEGYYDTRWLNGPWSTQAKVEGIVLKAAWHWRSNSSVVNAPLGKPGHTQHMSVFRTRGTPWTVTVVFLVSRDSSLKLVNSERYELKNKQLSPGPASWSSGQSL